MRVVIYSRVSTFDQNTLNQEAELKDYCGRMGWEVVKTFTDSGVSGSKTSRPALDEMLKGARSKDFEAIVIWKLDRLGRSTQHLLMLLEEFKSKGIRLIITSMNMDTETAQGMFFFTIIGAVAELEREFIRERINLGMARKLKEYEISGKKWGRPKGSKDKGVRRKSGYYLRYAKK